MPIIKKAKFYYKLTKPGIVRGNSISVIAGVLLACQGDIRWLTLLYVVVGSMFVMSGGCVLNNYIDRDIDKLMTRTKTRALASGTISPIGAMFYGLTLAVIGLLILYFLTNPLTAYIGIFGFVFYVYVYAYFKRRTDLGTIVGAVAGAIPPVAGYVSVSNNVDIGAQMMFLILMLWQLPHFYAITIFRSKEYAQAKIPVLSLTKGIETTKKHIVVCIVLFIAVSLLPYRYSLVGRPYMIIMTLAGIYWLYVAVYNYKLFSDVRWSRKVFGSSLMILTIFAIAIFFDSYVL